MEKVLKPTVDISESVELPDDIKAEFLEAWDPPEYFGGGDNSDGYCGRCGASVNWSVFVVLHKTYHKNISFALWLSSRFIVKHNETHAALGEAFPVIVEFLESALGEK